MTPASDLHVRLCDGGSAEVWCVSSRNQSMEPAAEARAFALAAHTFAAHPDAASLSITDRTTDVRMTNGHWRADGPVEGPWFLNGRIADLVGFAAGETQRVVSQDDVDTWVRAANGRGLAHLWHADAAFDASADSVSGTPAKPLTETTSGIRVGIDAAWLMGGESGAQVFVIEMLLALAGRPEITSVTLLSDGGRLPSRLADIAKVTGMTWADALSQDAPVVDVLHRPYQPDDQVDFARYRRAGRVVVLTVLDYIAYDIATYHESPRSWRRHRVRFDEQIELADGVFAISHSVARRTNWQFAGRLPQPARAIELGTDHLDRDAGAASAPKALSSLAGQPFLVVLGNDFAHKNRDFAVRVFAELCDRGYEGHLVLAGFHLDCGSSSAYEMDGAGRHASRISRLAPVTAAERNWLLTEADVVLYPTCAEGFGLIPFEAAALGTPCAFVSFGPLAETMAGVDASSEWRVAPFADLVERLRREPARQVASIRDAARRLTWTGHVAQVVEGYRELLSGSAGQRRRALPGPQSQAWRVTQALVDRLTAAVERRARRVFRYQSA